MGRKSTAQKILENLKEEEETEELFLVVYDFIEEKPNPRFWCNFVEIISKVGGRRVQYSVYQGTRKGARAIRELASFYGADVRMYAAIEIA